MKARKRPIFNPVRVFLVIFLISWAATGASAQAAPDFSGTWKQDNDRCKPKRSGDVRLTIEHREPEFTVETMMSHGSQNPRHAVQKYTTDGKVSVSIGADGDEFHTSVVWKDASLVFSIEEHEDGRIFRSKETWLLTDADAMLQRTRVRPNGEIQMLIYRREQTGSK